MDDEIRNIDAEQEALRKQIQELTRQIATLDTLKIAKRKALKDAVRRRIIAAVVETGPDTGAYYYVKVNVPLDERRYTAIVHTQLSPTVRVLSSEPMTADPPVVWRKPAGDNNHVKIFHPVSTDTASTQLVNVDGFLEERMVTHGN